MGEVLVICMSDLLICINIVGKQCALGDLDIAEQIVTKVGLGITLSTYLELCNKRGEQTRRVRILPRSLQ